MTGVSNGNLRGRVLFGFASTVVLVFRFFVGAFFVGAFFVVFAFAFVLLADLDFGLLVSFLEVVFVFVLEVFSDTVDTEP